MSKLKLIPAHQRERLSKKQIRTVESYSSPVKLKAVLRWKPRMAAARITLKDLAEKVGKPSTRLSEWMNFTHEPEETNFLDVESTLYKFENA